LKLIENKIKQKGLDGLPFFLDFVSTMPRISLSPYTLIRNLLMYFTRERDNNGPLLPVAAVQERVAEGLDISMQTVYRAKKATDTNNGNLHHYLRPL
jgi:hypothetical protein